MDIAIALLLILNPVKADAWLELYAHGRQDEFACMERIFFKESSWNPEAVGDNGTSVGLPQRHTVVHGWPESSPWPVRKQVAWALEYADQRYGGLCEALEFHERNNWW